MNDIPVRLMMTLAQNEQAMHRFSILSPKERCQIVAQASQAGSRQEMQAIVQCLT